MFCIRWQGFAFTGLTINVIFNCSNVTIDTVIMINDFPQFSEIMTDSCIIASSVAIKQTGMPILATRTSISKKHVNKLACYLYVSTKPSNYD